MIRSLLRMLLQALFKLMFRVEIIGKLPGRIPERLLIVANHQSFLDGVLLWLFLPVDPVFVVHTTIENNRFFHVLLKLVDHLSVDPANPMAMKQVIRLLEKGRPVVIFPEGRITTTGGLMKVYEGPAFVAARTGASILPVRVEGATRSYFSRLSGNNPRYLFPKIKLVIMELTTISMPEAAKSRKRRQLAGERMRRLLQETAFAARPQHQTLFGALCDAMDTFGRKRKRFEDMTQKPRSAGYLMTAALLLGRKMEALSSGEECIGLLLPNVLPTLSVFFGLVARRRVPAMLNYTAGSDALQAACTAAQIRTILTSHAFVEQARLGDKLNSLQGVQLVYLEDIAVSVTLGEKLRALVQARFAFKKFGLPAAPDDRAVVLFTSGSEGMPKGVALSHRAILANIAQICSVIDISVEDRVFNAMPMFHSFGLTAGTLLPVLTGASLFLYPSPLHYRVIPELVYDRSCTVLFGTSTFLGNYARFAHPYDFYRLRYVVAGAEKLAETVRNLWFEKFGLRIFEGYGATETAPVLAVNTPMAYRSGTVGNLLPGIKTRLMHVEGVKQGGVLHVQGPNVMSGYLRVDKPGVLQPPTSATGDGWYDTGDVVDIDADGFIHILGRMKRFAKIAGEMVSLEIVEKLAQNTALDAQHAAIAQPDPDRGEILVLCTTDSQLTRDQLLATARAQGTSELAVPRTIHCMESLPLMGTGKTDYVRLQQMVEAL